MKRSVMKWSVVLFTTLTVTLVAWGKKLSRNKYDWEMYE